MCNIICSLQMIGGISASGRSALSLPLIHYFCSFVMMVNWGDTLLGTIWVRVVTGLSSTRWHTFGCWACLQWDKEVFPKRGPLEGSAAPNALFSCKLLLELFKEDRCSKSQNYWCVSSRVNVFVFKYLIGQFKCVQGSRGRGRLKNDIFESF